MQKLNDIDLINCYFPFHLERGIKKGDIHSFYLSYLIFLADSLRFSPISESRLINKDNAAIDDRCAIRPDSRWYSKIYPFKTKVLIEYEKKKIEEKIKNLLIMAEDCHLNGENNILSILIYHVTPNEQQPDLSKVFKIAMTGTKKDTGFIPLKDNGILIIKNLLNKKGNYYKIIRFDKMAFFFNRENISNLI